MTEPAWYSVLPPVLAIVLAIWTKQVILALFAGVWIGYTLIYGLNPVTGFTEGLEGLIAVFGDAGDARVLLFALIIGAVIATIQHSGGVRGFVRFVETRRWVHDGKRAQWLAWLVGIVIFIESNITPLVAGAVSRPLFDRFRVSREKLAYIIYSTSSPVCAMIPLNAWGAVIIGLVASTGVANPLEVFVASLPFNLSAIAAILLAAFVIWRNVDIGPMRAAEERTRRGEFLWPGATPMVDVAAEQERPGEEHVPSAAFMLVPILAMVVMMPVGLYITGEGNLIQGSGSQAVLWAVCAALATAWVMGLATRRATVDDLMREFTKGAAALLPISTILLLALALGDVTRLLGTGEYVAGVLGGNVPVVLVAARVSLAAAFVALATGTSWGTFAVMIPIALPIAMDLGLDVPMFLGAAVGGSIFGDHCSPISDTTVVASMASATDHIDHVRTQLPYALIGAAVATVGFLGLSLVL